MSGTSFYVSADPLPLGGIAVSLENAGISTLGAGIATLGQVFAPGEMPAGSSLLVSIGGAPPVPAQLDAKTFWPDGSVKMAVVSLARPELAAGQTIEVQLLTGGAASVAPIDLAQALTGHDVSVNLAFQDGRSFAVDVDAALRDALATGKASFWQQGALATQARVEVLVEGTSLRLVFDVTAFRGGGLAVDVQFANDRAMEAIGGGLAYTATVSLDGRQAVQETVQQQQYQSWHVEVSSNGLDGGQGLGAPDAGWLNIRQDIARLEVLGVVADYDLDLQVANLDAYAAAMSQPGWGDPLSDNGVLREMPLSGGRADIGITTQPATSWLISQDARAAAYTMGWAEAAGAVPWRYWDAANGTWLSAGDYPLLWAQARGGTQPTGSVGDPTSVGPTQFYEASNYGNWAPEAAHQPDLSFVPYVLTGERWVLDNLLAQAAWNTVYNWPGDATQGERYDTITGQYDLVVRNVQVRAAGWALRQLENAAWAAPEGSAEKAYFRATADANWKWLLAQTPSWTASEGEMHGYIPNGIWGGRLAPWQQDYFASVAIMAASRGSTEALQLLEWMKNFLIGRFEQDVAVFNPRDGVAYAPVIAPLEADGYVRADWSTVAKTWAEFGTITVASGASNLDGWERSQGNYGMWALSTLAGIWHLTGDARAKAAYEKLLALAPPYTTEADFAREPSSPVTLNDIYSGSSGGGSARLEDATFSWTDIESSSWTDISGSSFGSKYSGPVAYVDLQYLGTDLGEAIGGTAFSDFINALGGDDAVSAGPGNDVLDGGTGSNFLTGGFGWDTFFLDGRGGQTSWGTITDWRAGEHLSLWGWRPGISKTQWEASAGAAGYEGVTLHADLDGNGSIDASVTWSGLSQTQLPIPQEFDGLLWFK